MKKINLFDTTLRDGEQAIGFDLTVEQKVHIFNILKKSGLDVLEVGMANVSTENSLSEFLEHIDLSTVHSQICLLSRLNSNDIDVANNFLNNFESSRIQLLGIGSHIHLEKKMQITENELFKLYSASIERARNKFNGEISFILEDASRGDESFIFEQIEFLLESGIHHISFADTVGCMTPSQVKNLFYRLKSNFGRELKLSAHFHNDLGLATANTLAAVESGAEEIQCTSGGIGERCGNASLEEIIGLIQLKPELSKQFFVSVDLNTMLDNMSKIFKYLDKNIDPFKPLVGKYAFSTAAGIHQNGILKDPETYSFFNPKIIGRKLDFVINKLSSKKISTQSPNA